MSRPYMDKDIRTESKLVVWSEGARVEAAPMKDGWMDGFTIKGIATYYHE